MTRKKLFYSIGDVAEILGEETSLVRYWTNFFSDFLKPRRNRKGNRIYHRDEVGILMELHFLIKNRGLTLDGAAMKMKEDRKSVSSRVKAIEKLRDIREQLVEVRESLQ